MELPFKTCIKQNYKGKIVIHDYSTTRLIIKEKYASEIQSLLKETKYYKSYEKRVVIESNKVRRGIIIDKYLRNPQR